MRTTPRVLAAAAGLLGSALVLSAVITAPASAATETIPASGTFSFVTANGILPTWEAGDIALVGVSPGSVVTSAYGTTARVSVPIIAKTGTANAAAGGLGTGDVVSISGNTGIPVLQIQSLTNFGVEVIGP